MVKYLSEKYDNIVTGLFSGAILKGYRELYRKGAYCILHEIINNRPKWYKKRRSLCSATGIMFFSPLAARCYQRGNRRGIYLSHLRVQRFRAVFL